jgi:type I restriction enzyme S subunit
MNSFNAFPHGWEVKEIKDTNIAIIDGDRGQNYPAKDEFSSDGFCLFLNTGNIVNDSFDLASCDFISEKKDALLRKGKLLRKDIVLTTRGTVGSVAYYNANIKYEHVRINSGMVIIRCGEELSPQYIYHLLKSPLLKSQYLLYSSGAAQPQLPIKDLRRIKLPIPKLNIQKKIAAALSAYDDLIENNKRRTALLEKMAEEIYREWFVRMRFPGHAQAKFEKGVPEGWDILSIDDISSEIRKSIKKKDLSDKLRYLGLEHIPRKSISITDFAMADSVQSDKLLFKERDILFGKIRPYLHKVAIAGFSGACSSDTIVIRPKSRKYEAFLLFTVFSETFVDLASVASKGTKMPRADWNFLKKLKIKVPNDDLLEQFQNRFDVMFSELVILSKTIQLLATSRDRFLNRLISGKLPVENLNIQFPLSMSAETEGEPAADDVKEAAYA